jgi:CRISPR-associated protein Cas5d
MDFGIRLEVWGEYAAFNRPEMKVERVSYDVMTPSAARGILEAIYWKPEMRWVVDEIHVLAPIRLAQIRRNEVAGTIPVEGSTGIRRAMKEAAGSLGVEIMSARQPRAALVLKEVRYGIRAHVEVVDPDSNGTAHVKHLEIFRRRAGRGQYFHHPYLGVREFPAHFRLVETFPSPPEELLEMDPDLGYILHDIEYREDPEGTVVESNRGRRLIAVPRFFRARIEGGVIHVPPLPDGRS